MKLTPEEEDALMAELQYHVEVYERRLAVDRFVRELLLALRVPQVVDWLARALAFLQTSARGR